MGDTAREVDDLAEGQRLVRILWGYVRSHEPALLDSATVTDYLARSRDGLVVVPREPTDEVIKRMVDAACAAMEQCREAVFKGPGKRPFYVEATETLARVAVAAALSAATGQETPDAS